MPLMTKFSAVAPSVFEQRKRNLAAYADRAEARLRRSCHWPRPRRRSESWTEPATSIFYTTTLRIYGVQFFPVDADHGVAGGGAKRLYFDGPGRPLSRRPEAVDRHHGRSVRAGQFPVHSGRILGTPGRILVCVDGPRDRGVVGHRRRDLVPQAPRPRPGRRRPPWGGRKALRLELGVGRWALKPGWNEAKSGDLSAQPGLRFASPGLQPSSAG